MESGYMEVLDRLKSQREDKQLFQEAFGKRLGMTQGHYSKAEQGQKRFSYEQLQRMNETEVDVHYIFTGNPAGAGMLEQYGILKDLKQNECYYLGQLFYVILQRVCRDRESQHYTALLKQTEVLRCFLNVGEKNIWEVLRGYYGFTQVRTAVFLGMDLRKYVRLEKGEASPDSEIIFRLYRQFGIPPQLMLGDKRGILNAMCDVLAQLGAEDQSKIMRVMEKEREVFAELRSDSAKGSIGC